MPWDLGFVTAVAIVLVILLATRLWERRENARREPLDFEFLFFLARSEGTSEFEQFRRAARIWRISEQRVEDDFKRYLWQGELPHYVRDHLRRARELDPGLARKSISSLTGDLMETDRRGPPPF